MVFVVEERHVDEGVLYHLTDAEALLEFLEGQRAQILKLIMQSIVIPPDLLGSLRSILQQVVNIRGFVIPAKYQLLEENRFVVDFIVRDNGFGLLEVFAEADVEAETLSANDN